MKTVLHPSKGRGGADHGWHETYHSFSFAEYYNPEKMNFGMLRVLNDDKVEGGAGFGQHPHQNMEIISIPLSGKLKHKDSAGNEGTIETDDVQVMSAGSGIYHSEFNGSEDEEVRFLQIWIFPKTKDISPRYEQRKFDPAQWTNSIELLVAPLWHRSEVLKINQDAFLSRAKFTKDMTLNYQMHDSKNGTFVFVLKGDLEINGEILGTRDAMGVWETGEFQLAAKENSEVLLIEVPMQFNS